MKQPDVSLKSSEQVKPEEFSQRVSSKLGEGIETEINFGQILVRLAPEAVPEALRRLKSDPELACTYFTFLGGVDWEDEGFEILICVYSLRYLNSVVLKAKLPRENPTVQSVTSVFMGADWHERECAEMFGITFEGHPNPRKLYLAEDFEGYPLRKDFRLASRTFKPWPGAKDPEEAQAGGR